jgi:methyltransferase (TIGR00027 family)
MDLKLRAHVAVRTRFIDHQVLGAIRRGIHQIVIVGAGYDDRSLRFRAPGVQFFELDHPSTQADKKRLLRQTAAGGAELTLAPVDLRIDDVGTVLAACGHAADRPSLFIAEGLLVYLEPEVIVALLTGLRSRCTATATAAAVTDTTTLVATLAVHPRGLGSPAVVAAANARRRNATAEPWRTILPVDEHLDLVNRSGWSMVDALDDAALGTGVTPGWSQLVVARPGPGVP